MPSVPPPGSHQQRFTAIDRAQRVRFRRAVTLMLMTLFLPGSAQLVSGNRRVGRIALWTWLSLAVVGVLAVVTSYFWHGLAFWAGTSTVLLQVLRLGLMALAVGWAYLFVDAWRLGQPLTLQRQHRLAIVGVNGFLCFSVAGALLFGAHVVSVQRDFMISMFGNGEAVGAHHGRYNVLLMGGDAGAGRWGLRPDSMTVASIDAETGKTVLISLPRNMQNFPFPEGSVMEKQFPDGFDEEGMYLNGLATWALDHAALFKGSKNPGVDATIEGVEGITGLKMNYWAMVNLEGFKDLVDAVGGVELNVRQRIPVGLPSDSFFRYIEPGTRTLNGMDTLWFARARHDSDDYSRMARQKCVMSAMLQQVSPQVALRNFEKIAGAELGDGLHQRPARRGRPLRRPRAQGQEPEDRLAVARAAHGQHGEPRHRPGPRQGRGGHREGGGSYAREARRDRRGRAGRHRVQRDHRRHGGRGDRGRRRRGNGPGCCLAAARTDVAQHAPGRHRRVARLAVHGLRRQPVGGRRRGLLSAPVPPLVCTP